ncbi:hypothetical protein [Streptomyces sp. NPDC097619]|uniref:hypothetical protein n=1 Tax=Streptomyces sp. NPDC097619 TaxID=3157228 RepID=UPI00331C947F
MSPAPNTSARPGTRLVLPLLGAALAALAAVPLAQTAARHPDPAPYGDRITPHPGPPAPAAAAEPVPRLAGPAVEARRPGTGRPAWTYRREGSRPLDLRAVPGHAFTLWDDGLVTDTTPTGTVRWHRAVPALPDRPTGALQPLDPAGRMLAVITPRHVSAYRTADGDLRWVLTAREGCVHDPTRQARIGAVLLLARPCADPDAPWTDTLVAVDALGRLSPHRRPLGNGLPGEATHSPRTQSRTAVRLVGMSHLLAH